MQFYRPLWPQRRLSSSLISKHEYDFSPMLAELPKDSKVASEIMNLAVYITKALMQEKEREKLDLMQEKLDLTKDLMGKKRTWKIGTVKPYYESWEWCQTPHWTSFTIKKDV